MPHQPAAQRSALAVGVCSQPLHMLYTWPQGFACARPRRAAGDWARLHQLEPRCVLRPDAAGGWDRRGRYCGLLQHPGCVDEYAGGVAAACCGRAGCCGREGCLCGWAGVRPLGNCSCRCRWALCGLVRKARCAWHCSALLLRHPGSHAAPPCLLCSRLARDAGLF